MDLEEIRRRRMEELKKSQHQQDGGNYEAQQQANKEREDMINGMLSQILSQDARARLSSIALVKPEKAKAVTGMLIQMANSGQISGKMSDSQLLSLLERVSGNSQKTSVKFDRRRVMDSDSD